MDDETFLSYCEQHCRTDLARFHREQVERLYTLAGHPIGQGSLPEWITVRAAIVDPLVRGARDRMKAA